MKIFELFEAYQTVNNINYDPITGLGAVGFNANVDYQGIKVLMKPSTFLNLATHVSVDHLTNLNHIKHEIENGRPIGPPYLEIDLKDDDNGNPTYIGAKVGGHEGRTRSLAIQELYGDKLMLVHLFFRGLRARHITPEILDGINRKLVNQDKQTCFGPFFTVTR